MKIIIQCDEVDGTVKSLDLDVKEWWWEDQLLCLVFKDGRRKYFNRRVIRQLEVEGVGWK